MVIAGSNGVGNSTLLYKIAQQRGTVADSGTRFLYQPPHRAIRKTTLQRRWLLGNVVKALAIYRLKMTFLATKDSRYLSHHVLQKVILFVVILLSLAISVKMFITPTKYLMLH